ncbi:ABC transporter substrate-binding protein [Herbaspirillum sp. RTI4]|uniref:ABC transporter substrate-binding protein n=1 Tax=Herbaspirillum sp. RTI4 TaxID=3048640 RepID=UPI002AB4CF7F|nr:ABC transporter substrate-binding protein [Herbaspirillum sp. RTI4]MDY7578869.1 ABC transporter substrate-binding protein [Herbaspirillum sp. RTI4]MEA9983012.1 ABC transporter substrate-binding protein [Herbaspirillum sp. RTI4]
MRLSFRKKIAALAFTCVSAALTLPLMSFSAHAAELKIGLFADISSLDPHFNNIAPNISLSSHFFDALVNVDANGQLIPGLATSWRAIDPFTWEFKLRPGVKFSDGTALTAEDVVFSIDRPAKLTNSPGPFTSYTKQIISKQIVDADTIRFKTATPYGPLALDLSTIFIVSKKAALSATTEDFNSGKALIGTGPFKFGSFARGDRIELLRNDLYWGSKPEWDKVTFRILTSDSARVAALLAGEVDAIESVPPADVPSLKANPKFQLQRKTSWRTLFWTMDQARDTSPDITGKDGKPLAKNPLKDIRVRQAISKAINRQALSDRTLEGLAIPASNIVAPGILGYADNLKVEKYDPVAAKKLLADAGYPNGFNLTLHGPNNRYINDERVVQTVAQFLSRIGIQTKVETFPLSVYFGKARAGEFSVALLGWGTLAADFGLRTLVGTINPETGWGSWNWGKYTNPKVDQLVQLSLGSVNPEQRQIYAKQAEVMALQDYAVIPLYHQYATWAVRKGIKYAPRTDEFTFAHQFHPG